MAEYIAFTIHAHMETHAIPDFYGFGPGLFPNRAIVEQMIFRLIGRNYGSETYSCNSARYGDSSWRKTK